MKAYIISALAIAVTLTACGGGGSSSGGPSNPPSSSGDTKTGVFTDSAVAGINYQTNPGNQSGKTNALGEYNYKEGDTVTFSIGDTKLPSVTATGRVTPADMADGNNADVVINVLRLLQTLDDDGNPDNGITISQQTLNDFIGKDVEVNQPAAAFETEAEAAIGETLVTEEDAEAHFAASQQADLRGSWLILEGEAETKRNVLTFLDGGHYIVSHSYDDGEEQEAATAEWGTYDWDPDTGEITFTLGEQSDGSGGLIWEGTENNGAMVLAGDELHFELGDEEFSATPIKDADNPLVGAWYLEEETGFNVLTILDDSHYTIAHQNHQHVSGSDEVSSEWGTYQLDGESFNPVATVETDGEGGLYNAGLVDEISGDYYSLAMKRWGDLNFIEHHPDGANAFSFSRIGRFAVDLEDLAGNASTVVVEREESGFFEWFDIEFSIDLVGEDDKVNIYLNEDGTGTLTFSPGTEDEASSIIDAPWEATTSGTLMFTETMTDGSTGSWTLAPVKSGDMTAVIVDFRHVDGGTESLLGFFISDLADSVGENEALPQ